MSWTSGRAKISASNPLARAVCDRCQFVYNLVDLNYQYQWAGTVLNNLQLKVCDRCLDMPQEQIRAIVLPADPVPVADPRPERYQSEVPSYLQTQEGPSLLTEDGSALIWEIRVTPVPDPNQSYLVPDA